MFRLPPDLLRSWRIYMTLTATEAAQRAGVSYPTYIHAEQSTEHTRASTLLKIIRQGFGLSIEQFLEGPPQEYRDRAAYTKRLRGVAMPTLSSWMHYRELTAPKLAKLAGVSPTSIGRALRGDNINVALAQRLINALGVDTKTFYATRPTQPLSGPQEPATRAEFSMGEVLEIFDAEHRKRQAVLDAARRFNEAQRQQDDAAEHTRQMVDLTEQLREEEAATEEEPQEETEGDEAPWLMDLVAALNKANNTQR